MTIHLLNQECPWQLWQLFSYIQYSNVAARVTRQALKADFKVDAAKRDIAGIKFQKWEAGKPVGK